jgi:transposase
MNSSAFAAYVAKVPVPEPVPGTVVILDNLATQKNASAAKAMRDAGCLFLFLPPYSPDLNPIEMAFSKLKAHLRRIGARTFTDMSDAIAEVCNLYSPQKCWNYFKAAGYVSGQRRFALGHYFCAEQRHRILPLRAGAHV